MIEKLGLPPQDDEGGIVFWRKNILRMMTLTLVVVGTVAYFPSVWLSLRERLYGLVLATSLAYVLLLLIHFSHRLSYYIKVGILVVVFYLLALFVFLDTGKHGAGLLWLFSVAPIAGLLLGFWHGIYLLVIDAVTLSVLGIVLAFRPQAFPALLDFDITNYIVVCVNFMLVNAVVTLPLAALLDGLRATIEKERAASQRASSRMQRIEALRNIDRAINQSLDLDVTLHALLEQTMSQLQPDASSVLLLEDSYLRYAASLGFHTDLITESRLKVEDTLAGQTLTSGGRLQVPDLTQPDTGFFRPAMAAAEGFQMYNVVPIIAKGEPMGVLQVYHRRKLDLPREWYDYLETIAGQAAIAVDNAEAYRNLEQTRFSLERAYDKTLEGWVQALELRDDETRDHTERVVSMTMRLAKALRVPPEQLVHIRRGALLHDIGKMGVPDALLFKPGALTPAEMDQMRLHPVYAYEWLNPIEYLRPALDIPHYHHEKWDGSGYPSGLKGDEIPLPARIFAVIDVWDALTSDRPYRMAWPREKALEYIRDQSGAHFDPQVVEAFLTLLENRHSPSAERV